MSDGAGLQVYGGAFGLDARYDDLELIAGSLAAGGASLIGLAASLHAVVIDPHLVASAVLGPLGFARAEAALLAALDGPRGLVASAARLEGRALSVKAGVVSYRAADRLAVAWTSLRREVVGQLAVLALPVAGAALAHPTSRSALLLVLPDSAGDAEQLMVDSPWLAAELVGSAPGALTGVATLTLGPAAPFADVLARRTLGASLAPSDVAGAAGLLALAYPRGRAVVTPRGRDTRAFMTAPPRDVASLLGPLAVRDVETWHGRQGEVDVRVVSSVGSDGRRLTSYVVHVPGTKEWQASGRQRPHLNDLATNLTAMAGQPTARIDGIATALRSAGARAGDPVMLVGHSQGGLLAMRAAQEWAGSGRFAVTHVLAAGAPAGAVTVPESVQVLALESRQDVVVELDAADLPDRSHVTTVRFDSHLRGVIANHDLAAAYLPAAERLSETPSGQHPSVRAWVESADAFLAEPGEDVAVRADVYDIRNGETR